MQLTIDAKTQELVRKYVPQDKALRAVADFFGALGDATRIKILSALSITPMCVTDLTVILDMNQTTVSHQLRNLRDTGVIDYRRYGKVLVYYVADKRVFSLLNGAAEMI